MDMEDEGKRGIKDDLHVLGLSNKVTDGDQYERGWLGSCPVWTY